MKKLDTLVCIFLCLGGLNWGLIGLFNFNLIETFIRPEWLYRVIYILVGISAVYQAVGWKQIKKRWK
ncbi:DUF378 domain-containing protein [Candidatus Neptunochlamydia vexilliferae]|uniref:DUF378 domain-containing protein n=1 Tax=Candidatus Neptunichlamydia vexilliferae TaxID=1651774 RepID=A0ABS0AZK8_9BACT|nr:DUF378 domain-containing protein [Candidatus Neptunochlamydia vexilliferae]MBF5059573.1 hypothetical protein [Candidatus Neptunochlamydia vexilliferae]